MREQPKRLQHEVRLRLDDYVFDLSPLLKVAAGYPRGAEVTLLVEGPPGFARYLPRIAERARGILEQLGLRARAYVRLDPAFGSCDVGLQHARKVGANVVLHVGHEPYPLLSPAGGDVKVVYVAGEYVAARLSFDELLKRVEGARTVLILYAAQHRLLAGRLCSEIASRGIKCSAAGAPLTGCTMGSAFGSIRSADKVLVVAGGRFHVISAGLMIYQVDPSLLDRLVHVDPYTGDVRGAKDVVARFLALRYAVVYSALEARRFAFIVDAKSGQYRSWLLDTLARLASRAGVHYDVLVTERLVPSDLDNLAPADYDAYVITSCPHLPFDELHNYHKPVLTPGEARMVFTRRLTPYRYPW